MVMRAARGGGGGAAVRLVLRAQQVIENVDNRGDVPLGLAVGVLQGGVQRAGEGARVHALPVVVHRLDDGAFCAAFAARRFSLPAAAFLRKTKAAY
jgi:hypothetical protein